MKLIKMSSSNQYYIQAYTHFEHTNVEVETVCAGKNL
jgi:hypothetical protein